MLTPAKIKNHHFEASGRNAYRADSVDAFFMEVSDSYERMFRENGEMYKKISLLAERLEEYRNDEDNIRNALLTAQRMSEQIQREAREKADALLAEAQARAVAENARVDAETNEMLAKATYQAQTLIEEAKKQAEQIIYDATHESKEAAISARDWMIKEEAALEMMKIEVTKFKKQILDSYNQQLELIEKIPEIVYAQIDAEKEQPEEVVEEAKEEVVEEIVCEEPVAHVIPEEPVVEEEPEYEPIEDPVTIIPVAGAVFGAINEAPKSDDEANSVDVDALQQMINEAEDTDAEDEHYEAENDEDFEILPDEEAAEFVLPKVDDASNNDLNEMVGYFSEAQSQPGDVMFTKPKEEEKKGFSFNLDKISAYGTAEEIEEADEFDEEFDDDNGDDLASKFKSFFKK